ncbi:MAG: HEPN domain-containing protein [Candidatus Eremiobacteraeota bacterium]|nr:HEPN domain-containing protein [Candidatus Eremiobacteraeota bacterium]
MANSQIDYWIQISEYDFEVAKSLFEKGHYIYVGFMCHQVIEKILKAAYVKATETIPPRTHNLDKLITGSGNAGKISQEYLNFLDELTPLNIEARYPAHKDAIYKMIDKKKARTIIEKTESLKTWIIENWI